MAFDQVLSSAAAIRCKAPCPPSISRPSHAGAGNKPKLIDEYIGGVYSKNEGFELDRLHIPAAGQEPSTLPERIPALSMDTVHKGEP